MQIKDVVGEYVVYKNEFHPFFIDFLKGEGANYSNENYNFYRKVIKETKTKLVLEIYESTIEKIQQVMFLPLEKMIECVWL